MPGSLAPRGGWIAGTNLSENKSKNMQNCSSKTHSSESGPPSAALFSMNLHLRVLHHKDAPRLVMKALMQPMLLPLPFTLSHPPVLPLPATSLVCASSPPVPHRNVSYLPLKRRPLFSAPKPLADSELKPSQSAKTIQGKTIHVVLRESSPKQF